MGTKAAFAMPVHDLRPAAVHKVEQKSATSDAGAEAREHPQQDAQASASRDIIALRRMVAQGQRPAGPPPSFEVSLLEVESDLKQKLARMEVERTQARDLSAVQGQPEPRPAPEPAPEPASDPALETAPAQAQDTPEPVADEDAA
ncbi:MAG: hypothetical protein VX874_12890 [Pseudomonadota bacterium]|nr:hypothetical protein [Pseudomonadota bacterium]